MRGSLGILFDRWGLVVDDMVEVSGGRCVGGGGWCVVGGGWCVVSGVWCVVCGVWRLVRGARCVAWGAGWAGRRVRCVMGSYQPVPS